jgi:NAD(P)-dependent dehydrogenase (short-subunit alcohol dehydrogenase family)
MGHQWGDKTWFVTGASTGFGKAFVEEALARGGRAIATARDTAALAYLSGQPADRVLTLPLDVTRRDQIAAAIAAAGAFGGIDVLVNNAGYGFLGGVEESGDEEIEAQFAVNFFGALNLIRAALPGMRERRKGYIVNLSSIAGLRGFSGAGYYSATKFALEGLCEALAGEVADFGIRVMLVEPGYFRTDFSGRSIGVTRHAHPAYPELAQRRERIRAGDGTQPGDPVRGVRAVVAAMEAESPPLRLPLGPDGYELANDVCRTRLGEAERWRKTSEGTSFA